VGGVCDDMDNSVCVAELLYDLVATDAYEMLVFCCIRLRASGNESVCFKVTISCQFSIWGRILRRKDDFQNSGSISLILVDIH